MPDLGRPGWQWTGDPITGELSRVNSAGDRQITTVEALTDGVYTFANGRLFDTALHRIRWNTSSAFPFYFTQLEGDQFHLLNPVSAEQANTRVNAAGGYVFTYSMEVEMPNGEIVKIEDGITSASPAGARLAVRLGQEGNLQYMYERANKADGTFPTNPTQTGYRWATSDETRHRSLVSALLRDHHSMLEDAIAQGLYDAEGNQISDDYTAAQYFSGSDPVTATYAQAIFTYA